MKGILRKYCIYIAKLASLITLLHLLFPQQAYAYLDPGTGSLIIQFLIAAFLGGLVAIKLFWQRIKVFFVSLRPVGSRQKNGRQEQRREDQ